jgi:hypothetical protein
MILWFACRNLDPLCRLSKVAPDTPPFGCYAELASHGGVVKVAGLCETTFVNLVAAVGYETARRFERVYACGYSKIAPTRPRTVRHSRSTKASSCFCSSSRDGSLNHVWLRASTRFT